MTERLRRIDLADRFVEFYGEGVSTLSAGDRAVIANMTPEFGANSGFFPIDDQTLQLFARDGSQRRSRPSRGGIRKAAGPLVRSEGVSALSRTRSRSISTGSRSASQVRAGRRTASRPAERSRRLRRCWRARPCRVICRAARQRRRGDRCDHELHQHVRSETSGRRRSARPQGAPLRPHPARLGEDVTGARLADRRALPAPRRPAGGPRGRGLRHRRLWLHDLHRQFRPAAGDHRAGHGRAGHSSRRRSVGQPQLPRSRPSAARGGLPGLASAGRRLRARRRRQSRHPHRSHRPLAVGRRHSPRRSLADGRRDRCGPRHRHRCRRLRHLIRRGRGERGLARARCSGHSPCSPGTRARPTSGAHPSRASARARCSAPMQRIRCSCSATTSPPTTSRRPG